MQEYGFSEVFSFRAAPPVGADTSVNFFVIADMGQAMDDGSNEMRVIF